MSGRVVAVSGLAAETRIAAGDGVVPVARGGRNAALADAIEATIGRGAVAIVSFGLAGALDPSMRPGTLIVADAVVGDGARRSTDVDWSRRVRVAVGAVDGAIVGGDLIVADAASKKTLHETTGAIAVDMESHVAARIAARHALPFIVLRAIADPARRTLPPAAAVAMRADGSIDLAAVLRSIATRPGQLPDLLAVAGDTRRAMRALRRARVAVGARFGFR